MQALDTHGAGGDAIRESQSVNSHGRFMGHADAGALVFGDAHSRVSDRFGIFDLVQTETPGGVGALPGAVSQLRLLARAGVPARWSEKACGARQRIGRDRIREVVFLTGIHLHLIHETVGAKEIREMQGVRKRYR